MNKLENFFHLELHLGEKVMSVDAKIERADLERSWDEFSHLYAEPAFKQLIAEMKYQLESAVPADPADSPPAAAK